MLWFSIHLTMRVPAVSIPERRRNHYIIYLRLHY